MLFENISSGKSGITFSNNLQVSDSFNILDYNYFYNGGGVAAADFNKDGLTDLYFTGNQVSSRLYLNKGKFSFADVTDKSGTGTTNWATGVAVADVNGDGWPDMYVSCAGYKDPLRRANQLFINKGLDKDGVPLFEDEAAAYGVADTSYTTQSVFFDYDRDGDLDLLVVNHYQDATNPNYPVPKQNDGNASSNARLYRNEGIRFTEISKTAGIREEGYGLSVNISDINGDGWPDIYIAKDFVYDDALYINNQNGSFTESIRQYLHHTSQFSMGCDIADYNNDLYPDIVTVDMLPNDNKRQKLMNIAMNNDRFNYTLELGYMPQYARNMLQLNNGPDGKGAFSFSEIGQLAGIYKTDWSWSPLFADFDNDGWKDLYISNGIPRDITNNDFISYRAEKIMSQVNTDVNVLKAEMLRQIEALEPVDKPNFIYQNNRNLTFADQSKNWGLDQHSFSNGAVYVDLDNDGDLDLVTNNINAAASVFKNGSRERNGNHFLRVQLQGPYATGAKILLYSKDQQQMLEYTSCRGFQSSQEPVAHFGLGTTATADSLIVIWLNGKKQVITNLKINQTISLTYTDGPDLTIPVNAQQLSPLFKDITDSLKLQFTHTQKPFEDFNMEPLLPHRFSANGPYTAVGDVDNNGLDDLWIGGPAGIAGKLFRQKRNGQFEQVDMPDPGYEDMGGVFFDADGDRDLDLYVVSGGNAYNPLTEPYGDRLYLNDGKGGFTLSDGALPPAYNSGSVVTAHDFDKDGDVDLFVGGRVVPTRYPLPPQSCLLVNNGKGQFENRTAALCSELTNIGMITSALWSDFDNDGWTDLVIAGEWMPVTSFKNNKGHFQKLQSSPEVQQATGWWFSLAAGDFDGDGDTDYIAGNLGLNNKYGVTPETPLSVYTKDYDNNGSVECLLSYYLDGKEYLVANRDIINSVMPSVKKKFDNYTKFAEADFAAMFSSAELSNVHKLQATNMASVYIENSGGGIFKMRPLPIAAQVAPVQSMVVKDFDGDQLQDILLAGNFYSPEFMTGRYDASIGLLLKGNGKGDFTPFRAAQSGIRIKGDARRLQKINIGTEEIILALVNKGKMQAFKTNHR